MKVLLIDNGTTLLEKLKELIPGSEIVQRWDSITENAINDADLIVLSGSSRMPLVGNEMEFAVELSLIAQSKKPIIGICFGNELIVTAFGGTLKQLDTAHKGVRKIRLVDPSLSNGKREIEVYENHQWVIDRLPENFVVTAESPDGPEIIKHTSLPIWGMQIHPENYTYTTEGDDVFYQILKRVILTTESGYTKHMKKVLIAVVIIVALLVGGFFALNTYIYNEKQADPEVSGYMDAEYRINGVTVELVDGRSEVEAAPGSASKIVTKYFGNEVRADLNKDGREDVVFLLTQETGGSGLFYYVAAALNTENGYVGSDTFLLGDRIAPQTTEMSTNPKHDNVIVVNYADRAPGDPMSAQPSVGKSVWLKLDIPTMQFGEVVQNFEGESR